MRPLSRPLLLAFALSACNATAGSTDSDGPSGKADDLGDPAGECSQAAALQVPLMDDRGDGLLSSHNSDVRAAGYTELPERVRITPDRDGQDTFSRLVDHVDLLNEVGAIDAYALAFGRPDHYMGAVGENGPVDLCFEGDVLLVPDSIWALGDNVFLDQLALMGWKTIHGEAVEEDFLSEPVEEIEDWPSEWASYAPTSDREIMVVYVSNDSGDDYRAAVIHKCGTGQSSSN